MPILTEADKPIFFPSVTASSSALTGLILVTQTIIESKIGRTLDIKSYTQTTKTVNAIARFQYAPVVSITKVEIRRLRQNPYSYAQSFSSHQSWVEIPPDSYYFDQENQVIELLYANGFLSGDRNQVEIKLTYTAGFDFTNNSNTDVLKIKSIAGQMLQFIGLPSATKGISSVSVDYQSVSYGATKLEAQMSNQIEALNAYRPLIFPFTA